MRKDDTNFFLIGKLSIDVLNFVRIFVSNDLLFLDRKLYYVGKSKTDKRLVILDKEGTRQVFEDCHGSTTEGGHGGPKKTQEKIKSLFFWRGIVKDVINWVNLCKISIK